MYLSMCMFLCAYMCSVVCMWCVCAHAHVLVYMYMCTHVHVSAMFMKARRGRQMSQDWSYKPLCAGCWEPNLTHMLTGAHS